MHSIPNLIDQLQTKVLVGNEKLVAPLIGLLKTIEEPKYKQEDFEPILQRIPHALQLEKPSLKQLRSIKADIIRVFQKEYGMTTPNYYQTQWMVLGMTVFGMPFGIVFSTALGNFAFIGLGLPIGMSVGIAIGNAKDKKAKEEGKVINI